MAETTSTSGKAGSEMTISREEWIAQGKMLFGEDVSGWRFVCPSCGFIASVKDWKDAGAPEGAVAFSCVGRYIGADSRNTFKKSGGPCNYAGGGLFKLNPVTVEHAGERHSVFDFDQAGDPS